MLSHRLGFRDMAGSRPPTTSLAFRSRKEVKAASLLFPNFSAPLCPNVSERGNGAMSRSAHFEPNKGILLCFRSRSESVIVIFANYSSIRRYYRAYASRLCMLAYRFYTLSKPVSPECAIQAHLIYQRNNTRFCFVKKGGFLVKSSFFNIF